MTAKLATARLDLEPVRARHAEEAWPLLDDDRMWTYFPELRPASPDDLRRRYERWERGSPDASQIWLNWLCRDRSSGGLAVSMQVTILRERALAYVAYATFPAYRRLGLAAEAARCVIAHVQAAYGVQRFAAEMDRRNEASYRLAEHLGFLRADSQGGSYCYILDTGDPD